MPKFQSFEPIYEVFNDFINTCLLEQRSLLWPEKAIWTDENVREVKKRVVDSPILGTELSFTQKLLQQMSNASPEQWMLLADVYYIYYLPSKSITVQSKRAAISWVVEQAHVESPSAEARIWNALDSGFARTSRRYHQKHSQFMLILLLANYLKQNNNALAVFNNRVLLQKSLDSLLESISRKTDRATDMRHAILYMAFPDGYEPILSNRDKKLILQTYKFQVNEDLSSDTDEALKQVRQALSQNISPNELPFSFYGDIKAAWKTQGNESSSDIYEEILEDEVSEGTTKNEVIFISYRRDDSADITGRIYDWLVDAFSEEQVFKDVDSIPLGVNFKQHLTDIVSQCHGLLAIIGDSWLSISNPNGRRLDDPTDFVRIEIEAALGRGISVIPVLVQGAKTPPEKDLPPSLGELAWRQGIEVRRDPDFKNDMSRLIKGLKEILKHG